MQSESEFLPTTDAAKLLGLAEQTLASDRVSGRLGIPFSRFGRAVRYQRAALLEWAKAQQIVPVRPTTNA